jgi:hypothetical protein
MDLLIQDKSTVELIVFKYEISNYFLLLGG